MIKILGLDVGTTSIGWAFVKEAENNDEISEIINCGVRIVPLGSDEITDFQKGNKISINADRTLKRGARRSLQRFKQRRSALLRIFKEIGFIDKDFYYSESEKGSTFSSYLLRSNAANNEISKQDLVKVLLMLNKKRGYKSSRKAKTLEDGIAIDGMKIAKELNQNNLTPGQWVFENLKKGSKIIPDFYRSDLMDELNKIVSFQHKFYPEIINFKLLEEIIGKNRTQTLQFFTKTLNIEVAENKGKREETTFSHYKWRNDVLIEKMELPNIAYVLVEINNQLNKSSGYLGAISDRSKELYFNKETVGEHLYKKLKLNANYSLKNQVFYRQDYLDEFERIWETQAKFHHELDDKLKREIKDITIFYQRKLKSQKHLVSICEFEQFHKVIPKSSPLFQEFRIWQNLNNLVFTNEETKVLHDLKIEDKQFIFEELMLKNSISDVELIKLLGFKKGEYKVNFSKIEGNRTLYEIYKGFEKILENEGNDLNFDQMNFDEKRENLKLFFDSIGIDSSILFFDIGIQGDAFDKQSFYQFWHLLLSTEEDEVLIKNLQKKFGFRESDAKIIANVPLQSDYGSLSARAIKKILPFMKDGHKYDVACSLAGYKFSASSLSKEEIEQRVLKNELQPIKKNSLRNPVVEKILNQLVNVINAILSDEKMGKPDEIRIELARELKANNEQRNKMTSNIAKATREHEQYRTILSSEFGIARVTKNDIIRYKLWLECNKISIYTGLPIEASKLFSKEYDIEHIIPKSRLFDDSFSNKTICERNLNIEKSNKTAFSFLSEKFTDAEFEQYKGRVKNLFGKISYTKSKKLMMSDSDIPTDFINRQLNETQYIAKKAKDLLFDICKTITSTSGIITDKLREDWELVELMKELNWDKYEKLGLTYEEKGKNGERLYKIKDWTKRNDHRHHAMDAITVAFTKPAHIQYLNNLNANSDDSTNSKSIKGIENKYLEKDKHNKLRFVKPKEHFREEVKNHLNNLLVSYKSKSKVVTNNKNITKRKNGFNSKIQLTPRGQLHKDTVYGKIQQYANVEEKVNATFDESKIERVLVKSYKMALLKRLNAFGNDPNITFAGKNAITKNPIFLDDACTIKLPEKVKLLNFESIYTIRKPINKDLKIDKVIDPKIRKILEDRLKAFDNKSDKAFVNLDENPIWLNKEKGISIKRVKISGISNAEALHTKRDNNGLELLDKNNNPIPTDFISTGNNHHVAIYRDEKGNLQENIVSFFEAVERKNQGVEIIDKSFKADWTFLFTMKQNEFFVFPNPANNFDPNTIDLMDEKNYAIISPNLFRVQKISTSNYVFNHHLNTTAIGGEDFKNRKNMIGVLYYFFWNPNSLNEIKKVRINHLGKIVAVGEY